MTINTMCSTGASVLAAVAALVSSLDGAGPESAFFVTALTLAAIQAWAVTAPTVRRRMLAIGIAVTWLIATVWIDALLLVFRGSGDIQMVPVVEPTYLGLTATVYHLVALHGGAALVALSALRSTSQIDRPSAG